MKDDPLKLTSIFQWLEQFGTADKYIAIRFLRTLKYVSFVEFEEFLQTAISELIQSEFRERRKVAVFSIAKPSTSKFNLHKESKPSNDSAGRISHALTNLERQGYPIEVNPRLRSMVANRVKNIILVDDIIGSGKRFIDYWKDNIDKSVKSVVSRGGCRLWVVSFAVHKRGINKITHNIGCLNPDNIIYKYRFDTSLLLQIDVIKKLLIEYGGKTLKREASLGFGKIATPIIFQHGCPNNAPSILWSSGNRVPKEVVSTLKKTWFPLFPERGIPAELYPLFEEELRIEEFPELLWSSGQYKLALSFLEKIEYPKKSPETYVLLTVLALLSSGKNSSDIKNVLMLSDVQFKGIAQQLINFQLCDGSYKLTYFGKDVLERNKKVLPEKILVDNYEMFYPHSFMGVQRIV